MPAFLPFLAAAAPAIGRFFAPAALKAAPRIAGKIFGTAAKHPKTTIAGLAAGDVVGNNGDGIKSTALYVGEGAVNFIKGQALDPLEKTISPATSKLKELFNEYAPDSIKELGLDLGNITGAAALAFAAHQLMQGNIMNAMVLGIAGAALNWALGDDNNNERTPPAPTAALNMGE